MSTKYVTLTTISKTVTPGTRKTATSAGSRPVVKEIEPGTVIVIDDADEAKELVALGAIRRPTDDELKGKVPDEINALSNEQIAMSAKDRADLERLRREEDARRAAADAGGNGGTGGTTDTTPVDPVADLKTHADLDKYLADKGYTVQGWGESVKTVTDKQTALRNADKAAAEAAAAGSGLV
jgi:hypothetical protein